MDEKKGKIRKIVILAIVLILLIVIGITIFNVFKSSIVNNPYIVFGIVVYSSPSDMVGLNKKEYIYYYINEDGYVVESNKESSKKSLIQKKNVEEVKELEQYIIREVERRNDENGNLTNIDKNTITDSSNAINQYENVVWINGKVISIDESLIIDLINKITK